ncbi:MAG: HPr-rel-A system PqqD family peptide chaperone [Alphaproteobacteria bacterium]|nr:MAG: HPr-rel-A system PqqD family peptide chaperone [Alphaproteobacteria bacterium]
MPAGPNSDTWRWRANARHYRTHVLGDVTYVYCHLSGETHMLNLVSMAMLDLLVQRPYSLAELADAFPACLDVPVAECPPAVVARLFGELDDVGLVERVSGA